MKVKNLTIKSALAVIALNFSIGMTSQNGFIGVSNAYSDRLEEVRVKGERRGPPEPCDFEDEQDYLEELGREDIERELEESFRRREEERRRLEDEKPKTKEECESDIDLAVSECQLEELKGSRLPLLGCGLTGVATAGAALALTPLRWFQSLRGAISVGAGATGGGLSAKEICLNQVEADFKINSKQCQVDGGHLKRDLCKNLK